ncbi:class A beta-lactamase-related serine hydrolase [Terrimonas sp. NA20]|uniref:beta-lactamase n=1 Tax=Terrimonas ginsenosidimutans TaxID=2908004 RepID=A0ABS9KKY2_9BACT|nr:serine hydrolase [Terrimonas ginsenosidimutans]MCG2612988.1 class A beta-lactamase-related serine hydrolase [Terrimonas ginsenosidimutans]
MKNGLLIILCCVLSIQSFSQKTDKKLQALLETSIKGFEGQIGIYVKSLRTGAVVNINSDTVFPTASIVKVPIMIGIMDKIEKGEMHYDSSHIYKDSLLYEGEDILGSFKDGEKIALKKIMMLMLTTSDNTASLWLQKLAGTGVRINQLLDSFGFRNTRVNSRTPGREDIRKIYGWGQTSPAELGTLLEKIYRSDIFSKKACERMMRILGRNFWDENEAISMIPPYIEVFSKNGCVDASRSEVMVVNGPTNPYVFCVFTKNNKDKSWTYSNEAWTLQREISSLLWKYFEPRDKWIKP